VWCVTIYIPTRLLPTSSKQQQLAFSIYWKFSTLPILFFFISKNLLRALKQTTNLFKTTTLLSKLAFYDHLVFTKKQIKTLKPPQTKPYTCWKLNWTLSTTWRSKCQVVDVVWASLGFVHRVVEVTGVLFCSACSMFESLAIM